MKKLFISTLFVLPMTIGSVFNSSAQSFEGTIAFKKQTPADTVNYVYYIKGDKVRLDEISSRSKKVEGSFIIDLKTNSMISLSHDRKLYMEQASSTPAVITGKPEVKKTGNTKTIQGMKCTEYVVKNTEEKIQVTYWMASGNFDFFFKLLKILNRKDKSSVYILQLTGVDGMFPFLSSLINLETNTEEVRLEVTKVEKKSLDANMFEIPKDYAKFQK
ncbi:MAG: DUF4412 domain-containing protein [Bacteroidetes bacterium]|nr:DUF4412 domain-containing protein [Bacteroidota bacterium]